MQRLKLSIRSEASKKSINELQQAGIDGAGSRLWEELDLSENRLLGAYDRKWIAACSLGYIYLQTL